MIRPEPNVGGARLRSGLKRCAGVNHVVSLYEGLGRHAAEPSPSAMLLKRFRVGW